MTEPESAAFPCPDARCPLIDGEFSDLGEFCESIFSYAVFFCSRSWDRCPVMMGHPCPDRQKPPVNDVAIASAWTPLPGDDPGDSEG